MKHNSFVVFLDVDGVLNTIKTVHVTPGDRIGIEPSRVNILAEAIRKYGGGDIVLSSDWKEMLPTDKDYIYLISELEKYGLTISGKTQDTMDKRGKGIAEYLAIHPEIEEYVILDDNVFDFKDYGMLWERLLLTNGLENARFASGTPAVEALIFMGFMKEA